MAKILLVDDEEKMRVLYRDVLTNAGFEVMAAGSAQEGLKMIAEDLPDLVILDVMMPGMDGGAMAGEILGNDKTKDIPLIFLTSIISEDEVSGSGGKIGGRTYVSKSADKKELLRVINETLSGGPKTSGTPENKE
ncbi:MAG: response regulator [Candidatus Omnitrophota bacterium]